MDLDDFSPSQLGRFGGVVAIIVGVVVFGGGAALMYGSWRAGVDHRGIEGMVVLPIGALAFGLVIAMFGVWALRAAPTRSDALMSVAAARQLLEARPLPFWVCVRCRVFMDRNLDGACLECASGVDCLEVSTESERRTALSALG